MPSFFKSAAALAMAGAALANPMNKRSDEDSCLAAVTGKAALGDDNLRKEHCTSFFKTIVTPSAVTVTTTITDAPEPSNWNSWEKRAVTVCPNEVPNYASACDESGYRSACYAWGVVGETTITIPATTWTKTVYVGTGTGGICQGATVTKTVAAPTVTVAGSISVSTVIVTVTAGGSSTSTSSSPATTSSTTSSAAAEATCLTAAKAKEFTDAFKDLLQYTNAGTTSSNSPYHYAVSAQYLSEDFKDYSDSINWMAHFPLGGITFDGRAAFDYGQGQLQQPLILTDKLTNFGCNHITWKWSALTPTGVNVMGINHFILNEDLTQIKENHAEFDNGVWIDSFKVYGSVPTINCQTPQQSTSTNSNSTSVSVGTTTGDKRRSLY